MENLDLLSIAWPALGYGRLTIQMELRTELLNMLELSGMKGVEMPVRSRLGLECRGG
jgi:hypothetical protein